MLNGVEPVDVVKVLRDLHREAEIHNCKDEHNCGFYREAIEKARKVLDLLRGEDKHGDGG